jgi:tRNA threonylcarbamoyladenosine biosynthesis protein TsaE
MTRQRRLTLHLSSPETTSALAHELAAWLAPGDTLLLAGPVGAGKSHFARSLIGALLTEPEDIPSPTYTLVQSYDGRSGPVWHADLYRLGDPGELAELGLEEAFGTAICLVEWPERLGLMAPAEALTLSLSPADAPEARRLEITWTAPRWDAAMQDLADAAA